MGSRVLAVSAALVALGVGSAFGAALQQDSEAARSDPVVKQLKKVNDKLKHLEGIQLNTYSVCRETVAYPESRCKSPF